MLIRPKRTQGRFIEGGALDLSIVVFKGNTCIQCAPSKIFVITNWMCETSKIVSMGMTSV